MADFPLKNIIPYKLATIDGEIQCHWLNTFSKPFTEPFFDETITKLSAMGNYRWKQLSTLQMITRWSQNLPVIQPAAFIFHISRCGSTLVSQLLATCPQHIVLAEVPFFDDILRLPFKYPGYSEADVDTLLTSAVKFYGQKKDDNEPDNPSVFIKADSWHLFFYEQLRRLYPSVPFIMIYRRPDEVYRSHRKQPGMHAVPRLIEPQIFGFEPDGDVIKDHQNYLPKVLESYFIKCLEIITADKNFLLLNYSEGPMPMIKKVAGFANVSLSRQELDSMEERSRYHSKKPGERFSEEAVKDFPVSLNKAMELYHRLEEKRINMQ